MQGIFLPALLLLAFVCIQSSALFLGMARGVRLKKCNPLELTACSQLGYNRTQYSPHLYLSSRRTDVLEYFGLLRLTRCSKDLLFFICMTYQPICFEGYHQAIPPCRSVCESVRDGCLDTITKYGFLWPEELRCEKLPDHQTGVCIKPSAIIKNQIFPMEESQSQNGVVSERKTKLCPECPKPISLKKFKYFKRADFAFQGVFKRRTTGADGVTKLTFKILNVYKIGEVTIAFSGIVHLWSRAACICPELELEKTYMMVGYENVKKRQLMIDQKTIAELSSPFFERRMMKYALKYQDRLFRRRAKKLKLRMKGKRN